MNISSFLKELHQAGIEFQVENNMLKCSAPKGKMTNELAQEIKTRKQEIIAFQLSADVSEWSSLIAIKPTGKLLPFFCFHGVGGNVLNYSVLTKYIDEEQPLYGLQSKGLDGLHSPEATLEDMATHYISEIKIIQPHGPYFLGGGSMGGNIAFEVAHQLKAQGDQISYLILFDAIGSNFKGTQNYQKNRLSYLLVQLSNLASKIQPNNIVKKIKGKFQFYDKMKKCAGYLKKKETIPHDLRFWYIEQKNHKALNRYRFKSYDDQIILLRSDMEKEGIYSDPQRGWEDIAKKLTIHPIPGKHETLVEAPELGVFFGQSLKKAQKNCAIFN